jgi:hypothetical protein
VGLLARHYGSLENKLNVIITNNYSSTSSRTTSSITTTTSTTSNNNFNIQNYVLAFNIQMNEFLNQGFKTVYDQFYSHATTETLLLNIKSKCNQDSIICVGGADSSNNTLLLVSCGSCLDILTITTENQLRFVNGVWWYFKPGKSFGFATNSNIKQLDVDI